MPEQAAAVDANAQAAPAEQANVAPAAADNAPAEPVNVATAAADTAPAEPANVAPAATDTAPAEPVNDAPAAVEQTPAEPVNVATAAADTAPTEPANDAPTALGAADTAPAGPANDAPAVEDTAPAEPANVAPAAADTAPAEPANAAPAAADTAPAGPANDAPAAAEQTPAESRLSDSAQKSASAPTEAQTEAVLQGQEDTASETYSIILRNQIYGNTANAQSKDLSARLILRIDDLASLPACPEDWMDDNGSYFRELVLKNMESKTIPGIPFSCPVWVENPTLIKDGNEASLPYSRSAIVNGIRQDISSNPDYELNADGNQREDCEYTLMWTANREGEKPLYIINDSDTPLSLSLDADGSSVLFVPGESGPEAADNAEVIEIPANGWGFLTVTPGNPSSSNDAGSNAAGASVTLTPLNVNVEKVIPSVGSADSEGSWTLGQDTVSNGSYVVYRVKPLKTGDDDKEKTGDDAPGDTPDSPEPPEPSEPDKKDTTPDQPENTDHPTEEDNEPKGGEDLPQEPENVSVPEDTSGKPPMPDDHSSEDSVENPSQPDSSTSMRVCADDARVVNAASVDTADRTPVELYAGMMLIAGALAAAMLLARKKSHR